VARSSRFSIFSKEPYLNTTLLVANLAASVDASELEDMFTILGNVRSARVVYNEDTGISKGVGYVEMSTREELENCILHFAGQMIMVREDVPHVPQPPPFKTAAKKKPAAKIRLLK
jgi:RNA recognition motif-containing protein